MPIQHISDTALLTAYARATESTRVDALFHDSHARALAGPIGEELARNTQSFSVIANSVACRTRVFDELLLRLVRDEQLDLVINLGAGLDTRPWRLDLPRDLKWIDVDLPDILEYKRERLGDHAPQCLYESCAADVRIAAEISRVIASAAGAKRALLVSEGILVYLADDDVGALATELHGHSAVAWWITDLAGPRALPMMEKAWGDLLKGTQMRFAPQDPLKFFGARGWDEVEFRSSQSEAQRLGRAPRPGWPGRLLMSMAPARTKEELRRLTGVAVLHRN